MNMFRREWYSFSVLSLASLFFAAEPLFLKTVEVHPIAISGIRGLGAFTMLTVFLFVFHRRVPKIRFRKLFLVGLLAGVSTNFCWIASVTRIWVGPALILFHSSMLWSVLIRIFVFRKKTTRMDIATVVSIFIVLLISLFPKEGIWELDILGIVFGALSGLLFAIFLTFLDFDEQKSQNDIWCFLDGVIIMQLGTAIIGGISTVGLNLNWSSLQSMGIVFLDGALLYGLGYVLILEAKKNLNIHILNSYIGATEPIVGIILAAIVLKETIRSNVVAGIVLLVVTILVRSLTLYWKERGK